MLVVTNIDKDFARFQQTRDPEALAAVFDVAAPRLLLVAMHLCRDAAAAEDLVQTVFLQAIRDVEKFDRARPVMPWLLGILEHRAHDRRGRAHVTRERGSRTLATVGSAVADPTPGPQSAAEDAELRSQVAAALDSVPTKYREVLTLRLVHGLRAVDIAHAQGVSPETIRTKLRRGLAMLRTSLPRGAATASMLTLLATECLRASNGLPGMRRTVLGSIATPATAVAGSLAIKWIWGMGIAAAMVIGAMFMITPPDPTLPNANEHAAQPQPATGDAASNSTEHDPSRQAVPADANGSHHDAATTLLHGRVVTLEHGTPLANAKVTMRTYSSAQRGGVPKDWSDPEPVSTDADGVFQFTFVPPPELYIEFKAEAPGFVPKWNSYESLRQGIDVDAGTISLAAGTPLRLRVLVDGQPCPGLEIYATRTENGGKPNSMYSRENTDQGGYSDFGMCQPGTWYYEAHTHLTGPLEGEFDVPLQSHRFEYTVHLTMPAKELSVRGTVVDEFARPVKGLELELPSPDGYGYTSATTNLDGTFLFSLKHAPSGDPEYQLRLPAERTDLAWIKGSGKFHWGCNDLQLIVRRRKAASLRLEVVDAATGEPVEHFGARCIPDPWRRVGSSPAFSPIDVAPQQQGVQVFDDLRPAPYRVSVFPPAPYAAQTWLRIDLVEGKQATLRVRLAPPSPLNVTVVEAGTDKPMAEVHVALCRTVPEDRFDTVRLRGYRETFDRRGTGWYGSGLNVVILDHNLSNKNGKVTLHAAAGTEAMSVFLTAPHCKDKMVPVSALSQAGTDLRVEVEPAGSLRGVLTPIELVTRLGPKPEDLAEAAALEKIELPQSDRFLDDYPEIALRPVGSERETFTTYVDKEGNFSFGSLPPNTYEVWLEAALRQSLRSSTDRDVRPLATVTITTGAKTESLTLDASSLVPARATGRFFVDGKPWPGAVGLARINGDWPATIKMESKTGDSHESPWLAPGHYLPVVKVKQGQAPARTIFGLEAITIHPRQDVEFTAILHRRVVAVTLRDTDGKPLANRRVVPQSLDRPQLAFEWRYGTNTDDKGRAVFDPAPLGRLRIMAFSPTTTFGREYVPPKVQLGEIGATATELTARWPQ